MNLSNRQNTVVLHYGCADFNKPIHTIFWIGAIYYENQIKNYFFESGSELRNKLKDLADHLIDTIDIHSLNNSERIALLRILVSYTVPKLAIEKPSLNTEERLFQVEIIDSKRK